MEDEMVLANKFYGNEFSENIKTLVVDDDNTCLIIIAALLRKQKYQVATAKNAQDALSILRSSGLSFDLVISDVHMPEMNGFQLQQAIAKKFDIPVVFMSADERDSTALRAIESGTTFFILKPICEDDIRDLWQYAIMRKNNYKSVVIDEIERSSNGLIEKIHHHEVIDVESSGSICEEFNEKMDKPGRKDEDNVFQPSNKSNIVWTPSLHSRFLDAIREIGLDKAIPRKIHAFMDIPELTRRQVASHLQNYRMYLRKMGSSENSSIQSNLASKKVGSSSLVSNSSNKTTRKSVGNMNAATSAEQLIHGKFSHQADHSGQSRDKEFADFMTHHITHMPRIDESRNKDFADLLTGHTKRKTNIDDRPFETKEFVGLLTGHITQKHRNDNGSFGYMQYADMLTGYSTHNRANVELHTLQETFESTGAGTTLDISMLGKNNHTPISSGIANLTTTFSNQLNMENKDEEGTTLNIVDGMN